MTLDYVVEDVFHLTGRPSPVVMGQLCAGQVASGTEVVVVSPDGSRTEHGVVQHVYNLRGPEGQVSLMIGGVTEPVLGPGSEIQAVADPR